MPEGPELHKAALLVNTMCKGRVFTGKIKKSAANYKNPEVEHNYKEYTIRAESRGKEMAVILSGYPLANDKKRAKKNGDLRILFRFGMSGRFQFGPVDEMHKHAHLNFYTKTEKKDKGLVLSFVDVRRFGGWQVKDTWSEDRGPDPMFEYQAFRENVLNNLDSSVFNKPLCEVLHNQRYFNGIGNYLRAEIIFRSGIPPFTCAKDVLESLQVYPEEKKPCTPDLLELCHLVPREVVNLPGVGYEPSGSYSGYSRFQEWLQCYYNTDLNNLVDHDGRTMWFKGKPGPLAPKVKKSRNTKSPTKRKPEVKGVTVKVERVEEEESKPKIPVKKAKRLPTKNGLSKVKPTSKFMREVNEIVAERKASLRPRHPRT